MDITDEMLKLAVTKSVEAGLLPRRALREEFNDAQALMRTILQSALSGAVQAHEPDVPTENLLSQAGHPSRPRRFIPAELHEVY